MVYTTSNVFLETLILAGITHAFVNLGSDHPALLEAIAERRQRRGDANTAKDADDLEIITCPNEMVALSAAQGYAQVTGKPAAVIVHVDCGTQALAGAVHNVDRCRTPVFIFAGAAPYTIHGELPGSRNEFIFTLQDIPDQAAIVRQYMRHTSMIRTGRNVSQVMLRALTFANSEPKGPVYCYAGREAMEELLDEKAETAALEALVSVAGEGQLAEYQPVERSSLSPAALSTIGDALLKAKKPLVITSYLGRNKAAVDALVKLSELLALPIFLTVPTVVNIPFSHPNLVGLNYGMGRNEWVENADCILVLDSDVPWIPLHTQPKSDCAVFHIDVDPLKQNVNVFHIPAKLRSKADCELACLALADYVGTKRSSLAPSVVAERASANKKAHDELMREIKTEEAKEHKDGMVTVPGILKALREQMPKKTLVLSEAISNYPLVWKHLQIDTPGQMITSGGSSLGWGLGAAIGGYLGAKATNAQNDLTVLVVGDGSFLFGVPASAYWMARRYGTPFLTIVLNNGGWKSPRLSMLGVHPNGVGASLPSKDLHVTFGPDSPDFGKIAEAAGGAWNKILKDPKEADAVMREAIEAVKGGRCAVLDVWIEKF